jgi:hypothetical protein
MGYWDISQMAGDLDLQAREAACAQQEGIADPQQWAGDNALALAASPGWDAKWASAVAGGAEFPGRDEAVISDADILAAVQALAP